MIIAGAAVVAAVAATTRLAPDGRNAEPAAVGPGAGELSLTPLPAAPIAARERASQVWAGNSLFIWGGSVADEAGATSPDLSPNGDVAEYLGDGAALDPATGRWTALPPAPLAPRMEAIAVWTGSVVVIAGGRDGDQVLPDAAVYDPEAHSWSTLPPSPNCPQLATQLSGQVYTYGGCGGQPRFAVLSDSDGAAPAWAALPKAPFEDVQQLVSWRGQILAVGTQGRVAAYKPDVGWGAWTSVPDVLPGIVPQVAGAGHGLYALVRAATDEANTTVVWRWEAGSWTKAATAPDAPSMDGPDIVTVGTTLAWKSDFGICAYTPGDATGSCRLDGPIPPYGAPLVSDGSNVYIWGGRAIDESQTQSGNPDLNTGYQITVRQ